MATTRLDYDSKFEKDLHEGCLSGCELHPQRFPYVIHKECTYLPDFQKGKVLIEAKGRFRTKDEAQKYVYIRDSLPKGYKLVFLFMNHNTPMPGAKRRKDGTRFSMGEWATKQGIQWYTPRTVPKSWRKK